MFQWKMRLMTLCVTAAAVAAAGGWIDWLHWNW